MVLGELARLWILTPEFEFSLDYIFASRFICICPFHFHAKSILEWALLTLKFSHISNFLFLLRMGYVSNVPAWVWSYLGCGVGSSVGLELTLALELNSLAWTCVSIDSRPGPTFLEHGIENKFCNWSSPGLAQKPNDKGLDLGKLWQFRWIGSCIGLTQRWL